VEKEEKNKCTFRKNKAATSTEKAKGSWDGIKHTIRARPGSCERKNTSSRRGGLKTMKRQGGVLKGKVLGPDRHSLRGAGTARREKK